MSLDYYRTDFQNQIFPDYDSDPQKAIIRNFEDESVSNGLQAELGLQLNERFNWKIDLVFFLSGFMMYDLSRPKDGMIYDFSDP